VQESSEAFFSLSSQSSTLSAFQHPIPSVQRTAVQGSQQASVTPLSFPRCFFVSALRDLKESKIGKGKKLEKSEYQPKKGTQKAKKQKERPKKNKQENHKTVTKKKGEQPTGGSMESSKKRMDGIGVGSNKVRVEQRKNGSSQSRELNRQDRLSLVARVSNKTRSRSTKTDFHRMCELRRYPPRPQDSRNRTIRRYIGSL
jgi:hypothetical protein